VPTPESISLDAPLDELLDYAGRRFAVAFEPVSAAGRTLEILQITNMAEYVERIAEAATQGQGLDLPFWARIWPASMVLAHMAASLPLGPGAELLEIGAGVGVCGLFAAAAGLHATITDISHDALVFTRINALHNGLGDRVRVLRADFSADRLGRRFDVIIGAEVLYIERLHRGLVKFLGAHLRPREGAQALLARNHERRSMRFFKLAEEDFVMSNKTVGCKATGEDGEIERHLCDIVRLVPRKVVAA
jgi:predicted nicotinamide N-methyase